mgnify:CR=1 FL=1
MTDTTTKTTSHEPPGRTGPSAKRVLAFLLVAALLVTGWIAIFSPSAAPPPEQGEPGHIPWQSDFAAATAQARAAGKPTLLFFTADWCGPCQTLKADVLWRPEVAAAIERRSVPVKVDLTSPGEAENRLAQRFGVRGIPTLILLSPEGEPMQRAVGGVSPTQLTGRWLNADPQPGLQADPQAPAS